MTQWNPSTQKLTRASQSLPKFDDLDLLPQKLKRMLLQESASIMMSMGVGVLHEPMSQTTTGSKKSPSNGKEKRLSLDKEISIHMETSRVKQLRDWVRTHRKARMEDLLVSSGSPKERSPGFKAPKTVLSPLGLDGTLLGKGCGSQPFLLS